GFLTLTENAPFNRLKLIDLDRHGQAGAMIAQNAAHNYEVKVNYLEFTGETESWLGNPDSEIAQAIFQNPDVHAAGLSMAWSAIGDQSQKTSNGLMVTDAKLDAARNFANTV